MVVLTHYISSTDANFKAKFLAKHNEYRRKHGAPALTMSQDLCSSAQAWAAHLLSTKALQHSNSGKGENLYYYMSSAPKKLTGKLKQYIIVCAMYIGHRCASLSQILNFKLIKKIHFV